MKTLKIISIFFLFPLVCWGQRNSGNVTWFTLSLKGGYGTTILFNQPSFDDSKVEYKYFSPSYLVAGRFGLVFGDYVGFSFDAGINDFSQGYIVNSNLNRIFKASSFEYGVMLNFQSATGFFFDIGPKFVDLNKATISDNTSSMLDILGHIEQKYMKVNIGVGIKPVMADLFEVKIGLNASYSVSSIVSESGFIIPTFSNTDYIPSYTNEATHPLQVMLGVELTYVFGRYGRASCGKYRFMFNN